MTHPYAALIEAEATRAEADLVAFRSRAISVVSTSSAVVALLTGAVAFASSSAEDDAGIPAASVALVALSMVAFVAAAGCALLANAPGDVDQPDLEDLTAPGRWSDGDTDEEHQRVASRVLAVYVKSVQDLLVAVGTKLRWAIGLQVAGIAFAGAAAVVTLALL